MNLDNRVKDLLEEKLNFTKYITASEKDYFYSILAKYLKKKKVYMNDFQNKLNETIQFLTFLDFNEQEIVTIIRHYPAILHTNKKDYFLKYLILASLIDNDLRKELVIHYPKYLIIGLKTLYARYEYLTTQKRKYQTKYYLLKMTNNEFKNTFGISHETLLAMYPYSDDKIEYFLNLPENIVYKENLKEVCHA